MVENQQLFLERNVINKTEVQTDLTNMPKRPFNKFSKLQKFDKELATNQALKNELLRIK